MLVVVLNQPVNDRNNGNEMRTEGTAAPVYVSTARELPVTAHVSSLRLPSRLLFFTEYNVNRLFHG